MIIINNNNDNCMCIYIYIYIYIYAYVLVYVVDAGVREAGQPVGGRGGRAAPAC